MKTSHIVGELLHACLRRGWLIIIAIAVYVFLTRSVSLVDVSQDHLETPSLVISRSITIGQTFTATQANLHRISVRLVSHDGPRVLDQRVVMRLRTSPESHTDIAVSAIDLGAAPNSDALVFDFPPLSDSLGKSYYFRIECAATIGLRIWTAEQQSYDGGTLVLNDSRAQGDLAFATEYRYSAWQIVTEGVEAASESTVLALRLTVLLVIPGILLSLVWSSSLLPATGMVIASMAAPIVLSPLLLLWCSTLGIAFDTELVKVILGLMAILAASAVFIRGRFGMTGRQNGTSTVDNLILSVISLAIAMLRFTNVRTLQLPLWVDSVHHTLLTKLIIEQRAVPQNLLPLIPSDHMSYHFGFHTMAALWSGASGLSPTDSIVQLGQWLNILAPLMLYPLMVELTRSRAAAIGAVITAAFFSTMPAYYVTWGRYTQLDGLVVLPVAMLAFHRAIWRGDRWSLFTVPFLAAGLFLTHYRVALFFLLYAVVVSVQASANALHEPARLKYIALGIVLATGSAVAMSWPWAALLAHTYLLPLDQIPHKLFGAPVDNTFPLELYNHAWDLVAVCLALAGLLLGWRAYRNVIMSMGAWSLLCLIIVNPSIIGFSSSWVVNIFSVAIAGYIPLSILAGVFVAALIDAAHDCMPRTEKSQLRLWALAVLAVMAAFAAEERLAVINPVTVLATSEDVTAIEWLSANTDKDANFLVNARVWQPNIYAGTDGGYWLSLLGGRQSTLPPALYSMGLLTFRNHVNDFYQALTNIGDPDAPGYRELLRDAHVTHVYIGAKGGPLPLARFLASSNYHEIYNMGAVHIFEVVD